ncbi:helix-turn-helix transcriptional regulator [Streptomyces sp. SD15]
MRGSGPSCWAGCGRLPVDRGPSPPGAVRVLIVCGTCRLWRCRLRRFGGCGIRPAGRFPLRCGPGRGGDPAPRRVGYRMGSGRDRVMEVDPWAVVVRDGRWFLLCWSHTRNARRVLRVDRVVAVDVLADTFIPPADLDPVRTLEEHLSEGWKYRVEVVIEAPVAMAARWLPRSLGHLEALGPERSRLLATTDEPEWYARQLTALQAPFRIVDPPELREAAHLLGQRLLDAADLLADAGGAASVHEAAGRAVPTGRQPPGT